jgi:hypothetical protein
VELFDAQRLAMPQSQHTPSALKEIVR